MGILTPVGSKIVQVIAADKILADFGLRLWRSKIFARILSLQKGAKLSTQHPKNINVW